MEFALLGLLFLVNASWFALLLGALLWSALLFRFPESLISKIHIYKYHVFTSFTRYIHKVNHTITNISYFQCMSLPNHILLHLEFGDFVVRPGFPLLSLVTARARLRILLSDPGFPLLSLVTARVRLRILLSDSGFPLLFPVPARAWVRILLSCSDFPLLSRACFLLCCYLRKF